ncbi:SRPBCC family protein [Gilvibacter sediminis]|uniref:SRPBCC family protein n=1 Tax=Gilvibacter sediminis TaxID=379071 RepID=UPI00234FDF94|nr:SRPBCC family protein [Gilvibacter sediminis]MDC7998387.1 SRPBCC family protein [Gilvibacter sediminis]
MKSIFKTAIALFTITLFTANVNAQNSNPDLSYTLEVDASADKVWEQIRKMDNIDKISSYVAKLSWKGNKGVGGERKCVAPDGKGYYVEKIQQFDDTQRYYQWEVVEGVPAKNVKNSFKVVDLGYNKSMIIFRSNFEFMENPNMTEEQFKAFFKGASTEIVTNYAKLAME